MKGITRRTFLEGSLVAATALATRKVWAAGGGGEDLIEVTGTGEGSPYAIGMGGFGELVDGRLSRYVALDPDRQSILTRLEREAGDPAHAHRAAWREAVRARDWDAFRALHAEFTMVRRSEVGTTW